ncbi:MAG: VOC family protein [Candidatus Sumerlaeia bacterium]|nr:VOC family protein [Candidatus Sumerlaeia bacterium]
MARNSTIIPTMRYRDAHAAIASLCEVLGFEEQLVVPGPDGTIAHAQLRLGGGMVMLGSATDTEFGRWMAQPGQVGGLTTQAAYVVVPDADAVYERVNAAGWSILLPIKDEDYGGRGFTCADPERHVWSVGTYDPWK